MRIEKILRSELGTQVMQLENSDPEISRSFRGRCVLVTGGAGFIGSHLVEALVRAGAKVSVVDDLRNADGGNLASVKEDIRLIRASAQDGRFRASQDWRGLEFIFHLANESYVPPSLEDPFTDLANNAMSTLGVMEMARRQCPSARVLYASSAAVYGQPESVPIGEETPRRPISPYGASKLAAEEYVSLYCRLYDLRAASLRLFSVFGPRQRKQIVYDLFHKLIETPGRLEIFGDGTQVRDLVYVQDVVRAFLIIACRGGLDGRAYNVGTGRGIATRDLAVRIAETAGLSPALVFTGRTRPGDPDRWLAGTGKLEAIGFQPLYSLEFGLKAVWEWMRAGGASFES